MDYMGPAKEGDVKKLLGLRVVALKGELITDKRKSRKPDNLGIYYILFNDGESYIQFEDQCYHTYHDCDTDARIHQYFKNAERWKDLRNNYPDALYGFGW